MLKFFKRPNSPATSQMLHGTWWLAHVEGRLDVGQNVLLDFTDDGRLTYTIYEGRTEQIIHLVYRVADNVLITDQLSDPHEERTIFRFDETGCLMLEYEGGHALFRRGERV